MIDQQILDAFAIEGAICVLPGGQQNSYRVGDYVVKKNDGDNDNYQYIAHILSTLSSSEYRVTKPIPSIYGPYLYQGYIVTKFEEGELNTNNLKETLAVSRALRNDLKVFDVNRLKQVNTQWAIAMDILFRQRAFPDDVQSNHKEQCMFLINQLQPYHGDLQIIHGDLGGNILFDPIKPPCIIDFSPLIAPPKMQEAIIVADAIAWGGKDIEILSLLEDEKAYISYLQYAVLFRIVTTACMKGVTNDQFQTEYEHYIRLWNGICNKLQR